jgi:phospholipase/lecithinase/hemolysin
MTSTTQPRYDLFVFGDSLSDIGNIFRLTGGLFPFSPPNFNGRFSNGAVAVETLAPSLGLNQTQATNFAVGGSLSGRTNILDAVFGSVIGNVGGLLDQVDRFRAQASALGAGAEDLYFVWAGANDLFNLANDANAVTTAVNNIATTVTSLAQAGAQNIVVVQTPNLGRTPFVVQRGLATLVTQASLAFNAALEATLTPLEGTLTGTNITLANLFPIAESIAQAPATFGFTNVTTPYLDNFVPVDPSLDPNQFFFWDDVHPTTRGHAIFADVLRRTIITDITTNVVRIGTPESDRLVGFGGNDSLRGFAAADLLEGNGGRDALLGGSEADTLVGGAGDDQLTGGAGADQLRGGLGSDRFIYTNIGDRGDTIIGFQPNRDVIDLKLAFNQLNYERGDRAAYVRFTQRGSDTVVRVDTNGDNVGGFRTLAVLSGIAATSLDATNFRLG